MRLKDKDIKEIAKLVDEGYGASKIATKFSYSEGSMGMIVARYKIHGLNGILHSKSKKFTIEEKLSIIHRYYSGESQRALAIEINVNFEVIHSWISKYEKLGYNGLIDNRGRPCKTKMGRPKKKTIDQESSTEAMAPLSSIERQELNKLRKKTYEQQMEIDCLKKIQALVQKRTNQMKIK